MHMSRPPINRKTGPPLKYGFYLLEVHLCVENQMVLPLKRVQVPSSLLKTLVNIYLTFVGTTWDEIVLRLYAHYMPSQM